MSIISDIASIILACQLPLSILGMWLLFKKIKQNEDVQGLLQSVPQIKQWLGQFSKEDVQTGIDALKELLAEYKKNGKERS